jgi:ABC-type nitrate/sulfonate/bicarbonate transport system permease component
VRRWILPVVLLSLIVLAWQGVASLHSVDNLTLASPVEVMHAFRDDRSLLLDEAWVTAQEMVIGLAISIALALVVAIAMHLSRTLRDAAYPLLVASQAIPIVVLAPLLVLAMGFGIGPKLTMVAIVCFFPITINVLDGLRAVDPQLVKLMRVLGASRTGVLWKAELPASLPYFFSGLRLAATVSVIGAVFGELFGAEHGLGRMVYLANNQLQTPRVYAGTVLLTAMALALFAIVSLVERAAVPWKGHT